MKIRVGILTAPKIEFEQREKTFVLRNVRIGIGFHWDRREEQEFAGELEIMENGRTANGKYLQTAVNIIDLEDYLCSVISSEMSANAPMELLKAHAAISRSWAIRAIEANRKVESGEWKVESSYESNGHVGFDVCADDHCQRYEGIRRMNERAVEAVRATKGQVLMHGDEICDCRFHKCCGGRTEEFETCWEDKHVPYLESVECPYCGKSGKWKEESEKLKVVRQSLNDYDLETQDYHDWEVRYTANELGAIVKNKSGIDFGDIVDLIPLKRGKSGRIYELEIVGTKRQQVIGKELVIRRLLSPSCLKSSWFDVSRQPSAGNKQTEFLLTGHGWGHGVGLCQIGATVMAAEGADYEQILKHYYKGTELKTIGL